jgi:3-oxoacyl-[acyl-carrier protein] reductase
MLNMDLGIAGKVALVTAGTKGIGLGIARALAAEGARVAVAARTEVDVKRTAQSLGGLGVVADLLTEAGCRLAVSETLHVLGPVDILINNLGVRAGSSWADTGPAEFESAFAGNLGVSTRMTQLVLPGMVERGWGRIVVIASVYGREAGGAPAYNAAKAAEISFTTSLAREVASQGVTVNCVAPGSILWRAAAGIDGSRRTRRGLRSSCARRCRSGGLARSRRLRTWSHSSARNRPAFSTAHA